MSSSVIIRKGNINDLPDVLNLIKELAAYEKAADEVENTVEEMINDGFGSTPLFNLFVAEIDNKPVGIAIYYFKYSTWKGKCLFLEDIVVTSSYRGQGIGAKLFEAVIEVAKAMKVKRLEWQVLEWNTPAINFYKKYNAILDPEWINGKLTYSQLQAYKKN